MVFDWHYALSLLTYTDFWNAVWLVIKLSLASWLISIVAGFLLALGKQSTWKLIAWVCRSYVWFFRSLPLLVLLIFVYNLPQVFPWTGSFFSNAFWAGLIAMSLSETAYVAEIHRGGLAGVHKGQLEAGKALGIGYFGLQRLVVLPQAFRVALPALINEYISMVKLTSLVSVISLEEILLVGERLYTQNFKVLETMLAVAIYYVFIVTVFGFLLSYVEKRLDFTRRSGDVHTCDTAISDKVVPIVASDRKPMPAIEAINIHKHYGSHHVLKGIDLKVTTGEVISVIGPSGSGKTSLIRTLNGLEVLDDGEVLLNSKPFLSSHKLSHQSRAAYHEGILHVGMVFQSFNLFPHRTVLENVTLAPQYHSRLKGEMLERHGLKLLNKVGMGAHAYKYPHQLSGGQQQRVAIARALAMEPSIVLFDEPTSALDPELVGEVLRVIEDLAREGMTMIIVTHEIDFAMKVSDRILFMEGGVVAHDMTPAQYQAMPRDSRVARFLKGCGEDQLTATA
ncbi:amino acid ABC transporter permease/ATP-binding protein [Burkholderia cenocepacia]|jgi:polar amino acid transport system permease protein|uniref:amino acid ABC transporter permease/ATP-binding protein n=1 Tax=Burkholderia cenocepacia TaxID=95486 RepID=UPI0004F880E3|nr:amino acid ABC transporter permease/ATP-binding protein [Burkholderia cenocepacia]AIO43347.1 amino ABC transporter, permease, 3-TM region, His/Glu/Gln/Arg/opine family domain protein [Burkholderia cepacia]KGC04690.1 amino ABC transporter, permease, 3-TM region, His/Glu/Gln/Arg/opine family domain protein [Burkholderia cepacia]MCG0576794.1 amino acid ABC transporter permease/ATP-binding protein [Burkholderia cenocepacia]MCW3527500.1 amino acid ABC transporter permease/ATP-binding protein [Bur